MKRLAVVLLLLVCSILPAQSMGISSDYEVTSDGVRYSYTLHLEGTQAPYAFGVQVPVFMHLKEIIAPDGWGYTNLLYSPVWANCFEGASKNFTYGIFYPVVYFETLPEHISYGFKTDKSFAPGLTNWATVDLGPGSEAIYGTNVLGPVLVPEPACTVGLLAVLAGLILKRRK